MKEKIINALKTKYSNLGFGQKVFDGVASYLEKTVTEDSQIETVVTGVEPLLKAFQSDVDKIRTEKSSLQKQFDEYKEKHPGEEGGQGKQTELKESLFDPESYKAELLKAMREELAADAKQAQQAAQRSEAVSAKAKEHGIPESIASKLNIGKDEDLDVFFKGVKQSMIDAGFEFSEQPMQGGGVPLDNSDIAKLIDTGTQQIVKQQKQ